MKHPFLGIFIMKTPLVSKKSIKTPLELLQKTTKTTLLNNNLKLYSRESHDY